MISSWAGKTNVIIKTGCLGRKCLSSATTKYPPKPTPIRTERNMYANIYIYVCIIIYYINLYICKYISLCMYMYMYMCACACVRVLNKNHQGPFPKLEISPVFTPSLLPIVHAAYLNFLGFRFLVFSSEILSHEWCCMDHHRKEEVQGTSWMEKTSGIRGLDPKKSTGRWESDLRLTLQYLEG